MYEVADLFDVRSTFAARLDAYMEKEGISKKNLCKDAHISRPTLDKLLNVEITNKANFVKHVTKILNSLNITPSFLMSNRKNPLNRVKEFQNVLRIDTDSLAEDVGVDVETIQNLLSGKEVNQAVLYDVAMVMDTSTNALLGKNFFDAPIQVIDDIMKKTRRYDVSGFWGFLGIKLKSKETYCWYPISSRIQYKLENQLDQEFAMIQTLSNRLIIFKMSEVEDIILMDEACDPLYEYGWSEELYELMIPPALCEACVEMYEDMDYFPDEEFSPKLKQAINLYLDNRGLSIEELQDELLEVKILFPSGNQLSMGYNTSENLNEILLSLSDMDGSFEFMDRFVTFTDYNEVIHHILLDNIALIELPLQLMDTEMAKFHDEMMAEFEGE